jgi:hypothetical protein
MTGQNEVVVLGAGFSHAISRHLPLANELGKRAHERVALSDPALFRGSTRFSYDYPFEVWLSLLAEEQPFLREDANLLNASRFVKLKRAIAETLSDAQVQAGDERPQWFHDLLTVLHYRRSTIITLNYDTLIEREISVLFGGISRPEIDATDLLRDQPPFARHPDSRWRPVETMHLLKLHGSLDWWWVPNDPSGTTLVRQLVSSDEQRRRDVPDGEPFIVPPLASKSGYYRNPLTRQLWQDAFEALAHAPRVALVGYSLPQTDIVMAGMLEPALRSSRVQVDVVNQCSKPVLARIAALGGPRKGSRRLHVLDGDSCVQDYVRDLCYRASADVVQDLRTLELPEGRPDPDPAAVSWRLNGLSVNRGIEAIDRRADGTVALMIDDDPVFNLRSPGRLGARRVIEEITEAKHVIARTREGHEAVVIAHSADNFDDPNAQHLLRLIPAGQLPGTSSNR